MKIQIHKDSGLMIRDEVGKEALYTDSFENALADAELEAKAWPDASIVRIFTLADGRVAVVRETPDGLRQEAAPVALQDLVASFAQNIGKLRSAQSSRQTAEDIAEEI